MPSDQQHRNFISHVREGLARGKFKPGKVSYIDPRNKLFQHLDRLSDIKDGAKPAPVNVEIDLTNRCNLGCQFCHFAYTHTRGPLAHSPRKENALDMGDQMDTDLAYSIIDQLSVAGVRSITWTGGGEPTLHPDFDQIIRYAAPSLPQGIYTNGTMITTTRAANMKESVSWVYVSLDRHTRESYRDLKQADKFDAAIQGIKNLVKAEGSATVGVGFLLDHDNWGHGNEIIDFGLSLGADYIQFRPVIDYDLAVPSRRAGDVTWVKACMQWLEGVQDRLETRQGKIIVDLDRFNDYFRWQGHPYETCHWTQLQTVITPNGAVWHCVNRRGFPGSKLGDLRLDDFQTIWANSGPFHVNDQCRVLCRGHLPNVSLTQILRDDVPHKDFI